ncbi:putative lipid II flippase FtsW [Christensenellaceae bacterium OttesenSCG-928-M15]|nr:putative lipid II flippase FtsW [Christensenellaceae bacterium OttesenSCG-928-M15]
MEAAKARKKAQPAVLRNPAKIGRMDFSIVLAVVLLCAVGLVMLFSASYYTSQEKWDDGLYYVRKQAIYLALAIPVMLVLTKVDYKLLSKLSTPILVISVGLLIAVLLFGREEFGAKRWLIIGGQSIQPSEIAKFGLIIYMSAFMAKRPHLMKDFKMGLLPMLIVMGVICGLVMLQPNMSMAVIMGMMGIVMLYVGGADIKHIALLMVAGIAAFFVLAFAEPYRVERLMSFRDPWQDPQDTGYQLIQSLYALGAGGIFGQGLNNSRQKLLYLTFGESDFVFSIVGEELGFIGAAIIMLLYAFIVYRGIRVALKCKDRFGSILAAGISTVFALQVLVNIGVVTGAMPTTGQALPFISSGGSSLLIFMSAMGVLLNISRHTSDM